MIRPRAAACRAKRQILLVCLLISLLALTWSSLGAASSSGELTSGTPTLFQGPEADTSDLYWDDQFTSYGVTGPIHAIAADRAGNVYVAGQLTVAGNPLATRIAKWDGTSWTTLGSEFDDSIAALAVIANNLYAAGRFRAVGGMVAYHIAKWDGTTWTALGSGTGGEISALAVSGNDLYVGGDFVRAGAVNARNIAKWDGTTWSALGDGIWYPVATLATNATGIYAGTQYLQQMDPGKDQPWFRRSDIHKWNGTSWSKIGGTGDLESYFNAVAVIGDDLYVAGDFTRIRDTASGTYGDANFIVKWDGTRWAALSSEVNSPVSCLLASGNDLFAGGWFSSAGGISANRIARWDGSSWKGLGNGIDRSPSCMAVSGNTLFVGGGFTTAGGKVSSYFAQWQPRVNVAQAILPAAPGARTIGDDLYGFYKPALLTTTGTMLSYSGDLPVTVTLDRAREIRMQNRRINGAFSLSPAGLHFAGEAANLCVEFSEDDVADFPGTSYTDFRAMRLSYPANYPASKELVQPVLLSENTAVPVRKENGRQIYAIIFAFEGTAIDENVAYAALPNTLFSTTADLQLSCTASAEELKAAESVTYHLVVTNHGPDSATSLLVVDALPHGAVLQSVAATTGTCTHSQGNVIWELGHLAQGESASADIVARLDSVGTFLNTASADALENDPDASNNAASTQTVILRTWNARQEDSYTTKSEDATLQSGWSKFGMNLPGFAQPGWTGNYDGAFGARVWSDPSRFRVAGWFANQTEWLPYSQVGKDNYVRVKYYVWAGGQATSSPLEIPNLRLRAQTRYAVNSMLEVLHHSNADPAGTQYSSEFRPSSDPNRPSLYRVDFDPVDVPYLVSNANYEGIQRAFEVYATDPQDNGCLYVGESVIGTYPVALLHDSLADTSGTKIYATSSSDAGDLRVMNSATDLSIKNLELPGGVGEYAQTTATLPVAQYWEGTWGVGLDTRQVPVAPICGIVSREFYPGSDPARLIRVEEGKQYKVRWHVTSQIQSNHQAQLRLRARSAKFGWMQKYEIGGAWATGGDELNANNTIAQQALPGWGCKNPDTNTVDDQGGWYTMLVHSPLSRDIRADMPGVPLSVSMPRLSSCPGPGDPSTNDSYRDLKLGCDLVDSLSSGVNAALEQGNIRIDRIEVRTYDLVDDGGY